MEIETHLDAWSYEQRLRDAASHSQSVAREYPVALVKPSLVSTTGLHDGRVHFHPYRKSARDNSRESFLRRLQQVDSAEYGTVASSDEQQQQSSVVDWSQQDPLALFRKQNSSIAQKLATALKQRVKSGGSGAGRRTAVASRSAGAALRSTPKVSPVVSPSHVKEDAKTRAEIQQLEELLRDQRLSRSAANDFFYRNISDRETNILIDEVVSDLLWEVAIEEYDRAELAARKKELPEEEQQVVDAALNDGPADRVLIQKFQVDITRRTLQCLRPLQWLNDEVINFYIEMLAARDAALVAAGLLPTRSHFFNSFFYTKVSEGGYNFANVRRWTRKIDIFAMDKIFVPVNISNTHWCMAVIFMSEKRIQYYDSMSGSGTTCLNVLFRYLHDEMQHKKSAVFDETGWELVTTAADTPQQANGSDCGVFSCMFADYLALNKPLSFSQKDMEFHRNRMVLRIVEGALPLEEDDDHM